MQEVREEITRRIASLERRNEWLEEQRVEHQSEIDSLGRESAVNTMLAGQYQKILDAL
jgi:excinuclease UvrABC helicase subunit UvrB